MIQIFGIELIKYFDTLRDGVSNMLQIAYLFRINGKKRVTCTYKFLYSNYKEKKTSHPKPIWYHLKNKKFLRSNSSENMYLRVNSIEEAIHFETL